MSNAKQRITLTNLTEPQQMRELNRQLSWIWDQLLGGLTLKSLNSGTRAVIDSKASAEQLDALGNRIGEVSSSLTQTADAIRTEVSNTASGLQSKIEQQAGEISLRVTGDQLAAGLYGKLDANAPSVGVETNSGITINADGVYVEGQTIDLRTSDGDEYVNINEVGVSASSISAPNVMPRYDKWEYIAVSHDETQLSYNNVFRSLQDALNYLNGRVVDTPVYLGLAFSDNDYGDALLQGAVFLKDLTIGANSGFTPTIAGTLRIEGCSGNIFINGVNFNPANGANGITAYGESYVEVTNGVFTGNGNGLGIMKTRGGSLYVLNCEFYNFLRSVVARASAHATMIECKGNCKINADRGGIINACGYMPDSESSFNPEQSWGGKVFTDNTYVDQGSGGAAIPTLTTVSYPATATGSYRGSGSKYRNDVAQGWYDSIGRIRGCMWFDNTTIRSALNGKSVLAASLRLSMRNNIGRGVSVTVELSGTVANSGASGAAVTKSYGVIGTTSPGEVTTITIPNEAIADLVSGAINGLMLYSSDTGAYKERDYSKNYAVFDGAADSAPPVLTVIYQ